MHFLLAKDYSSPRFIRCRAKLQDGSAYVGSTSISVGAAIAKCRSEFAEREFHRSQLTPEGVRPLGIAAHPSSKDFAIDAAKREAAEHLFVKSLQTTENVSCIYFSFQQFTIGFRKLRGLGYLAFARAAIQGKPMLFTDVGRGLLSSLLKVWEGFRNPIFYDVTLENLGSYNKAAVMLSNDQIQSLRFRFSPTGSDCSELISLSLRAQTYNHHHIAYFTQETRSTLNEVV